MKKKPKYFYGQKMNALPLGMKSLEAHNNSLQRCALNPDVSDQCYSTPKHECKLCSCSHISACPTSLFHLSHERHQRKKKVAEDARHCQPNCHAKWALKFSSWCVHRASLCTSSSTARPPIKRSNFTLYILHIYLYIPKFPQIFNNRCSMYVKKRQTTCIKWRCAYLNFKIILEYSYMQNSSPSAVYEYIFTCYKRCMP